MKDLRLDVYVITDPVLGTGRDHLAQARLALEGGADAIQLRDKTAADADLLPQASAIAALCRERGRLFIVNDRVELALAAGADGVHVGQEDAAAAEVRRRIGPDRILGVSAATPDEVRAAERDGADYIGVGPIWGSATKVDAGAAVGPGRIAELRALTDLPIVAIGGLTPANVGPALRAGADSVAVISAVVAQPDIVGATRALAVAVRAALGETDRVPRALTIAGSDSGGGAGVQADLKTFSALGVYGASVLTAITAQNTLGVTAVHEIPTEVIAAQIDAVLSDIGADAVKTGMLSSSAIIETVVASVERWGVERLVVDPVMVAKSGDRLLREEAVAALRGRLLPLALVATPNAPEAAVLAGLPVRDEATAREAAVAIHRLGARYVLVKGGHLPPEDTSGGAEGGIVDTLYDGQTFLRFEGPRIPTRNTHGTGCTLASAIAAYLARGRSLEGAVGLAKRYLVRAIEAAYPVGAGHSPVHHFHALWPRPRTARV